MKLALLPPGERSSGGFVVSVVAHVVLGAALIWILALPYPISRFFSSEKGASIPVERISFMKVPDRGVPTPGKSGGDDRPIRAATPEPPRLVAPTTIPSHVLPAQLPPVPRFQQGGSGPLVGRGGAVEGVVPSYRDSKLWSSPTNVVTAPKSASAKLDSVLGSRIGAHNDSVSIIARGHKLENGDWTYEKDGKKYGLDKDGLYLGSIKVPGALLPHFQPATMDQLVSSRAIAMMNQEIRENAQRAMNADEFREAVKKIRERKEREKREGTQVLTP